MFALGLPHFGSILKKLNLGPCSRLASLQYNRGQDCESSKCEATAKDKIESELETEVRF